MLPLIAVGNTEALSIIFKSSRGNLTYRLYDDHVWYHYIA
jgi:hypothetical protein